MNKLRINKLGVLSIAKMYALVMLAISLIFAVPIGLIMMVSSASMMGSRDAGIGALGGGGIVGGLFITIFLPVLYGAMGFVFGAIGAFIYNLFAGIVGGVEIEVENIS